MNSKQEYISTFKNVGNHWEKELFDTLEDYVCKLYSSKKRKVNKARYELFLKKHTQQNKVIDLSLLPPCCSTLKLHVMRYNYVACIWKKTKTAYIEFE